MLATSACAGANPWPNWVSDLSRSEGMRLATHIAVHESASGPKRTSMRCRMMSAIGGKADASDQSGSRQLMTQSGHWACIAIRLSALAPFLAASRPFRSLHSRRRFGHHRPGSRMECCRTKSPCVFSREKCCLTAVGVPKADIKVRGCVSIFAGKFHGATIIAQML
jgi:hypothetical protein